MARIKREEYIADVATSLFIKRATIDDPNIKNTAKWCVSVATMLYDEIDEAGMTK